MRLATLVHVESISPVDASYSGASLDFWTTTEVNTAVSCACLMTLKPLIVHFFPGFLSPSSDMSDPTLRQVTARSSRRSSGTGRSSRQSVTHSASAMRQGHHMTEIQSPRMDMSPPTAEQEMPFSGEALHKSNIEAQLDGSVASTVPDEDSSLVEGTLRPPPRPRLRPGTET